MMFMTHKGKDYISGSRNHTEAYNQQHCKQQVEPEQFGPTEFGLLFLVHVFHDDAFIHLPEPNRDLTPKSLLYPSSPASYAMNKMVKPARYRNPNTPSQNRPPLTLFAPVRTREKFSSAKNGVETKEQIMAK